MDEDRRYLILISLDAVGMEDLKILKNLPNFSALLKRGSLITDVESIYPSLTYPAHTSIITGKYPKHHGIINNTKLERNLNHPDWYWYHKDIKGKTLYDVAEEKGMKTCSILWPVTARSHITYNMPEIFGTKKWHNQLWRSLTSGSLSYQLKMLKYLKLIEKGMTRPAFDQFTTEVACETIKAYQPQLLMLHLLDLDMYKHDQGLNPKMLKDVLSRFDSQLGKIIDSLKEANIYEKTVIAVMGDHTQLEVSKLIRLNTIFIQKGWLKVDTKGRLKSYDVLAKGCDGSTYLYLKNALLKHQVREVLEQVEGIECILEKNEIKILGADAQADFMVEAKKGYYFVDETSGDLIESIHQASDGNVHRYKACHGYLPTKANYQTFLLMSGVGIKQGYTVKGGSLIDHAPTFAKILGLELKEMDGKARLWIFNEEVTP